MTTNTRTPNTLTAADFFAWEASLGSHTEWTAKDRDEREARFKTLSTHDKYLVKRGKVDGFFVPENARSDCQSTTASPSGKYRLVVTSYSTREGGWNYTLGEVYRVPEFPETAQVKVAEVRRNYSSLWSAWVENHPVTGQDYLLTGEDYQGFTVVNLTTGKVSTHIPDEAFAGHGWCPTSAEVLPTQESGVTLKVSGCYWACPYELRLYDFTNPDALDFPEKGLPNLTADLWFDEDDDTTLTVEANGEVTLTQHRKRFKATGEWEQEVEAKRTLLRERRHKAKKRGPEGEQEVERVKQDEHEHDALYCPVTDAEYDAAWEKVPYTRKVYARSPEGKKYAEVPEREWKSEYALANEQKRAEYERKQREVFQTYADTEPLYQLAKEAWPEDFLARTGKQYQSLVNRWDGDENPFYFHVRVHERTDELQSRTANLVWGAVDGPVKAECWTYGKGTAVYLFPRTHDGWREALAHARAHISE